MCDFIQTTEELNQLCRRLAEYPFVTVDTEFIREKTYWPQLCLIQIASTNEAVCIDPLAPDMNLQALFDLMQNEKVVKVFHAARQDIEIFYHLSGQTPIPVFDTQLAAMVCGFGESVSYQNLVQKLLSRELDKSMRFTDWSRRPLSEKQISYALNDVTHLRDIYQKMVELLDQTGRTDWVADDTALLMNPQTYENDPQHSWKRLKLTASKPFYLALCQDLAAYREEEAKRQNRPRKHIMRDEVLLEIVGSAPETPEDMAKLRGLPQGFAHSRIGREILKIIAAVKARDPSTYPTLPKPYELSRSARAVSKMLRLLLMIKAAENDVAEKLIVSQDDLDILAGEKNPDLPVLKGWRFQIFGKAALEMKAGKIALQYNPERHRIDLVTF
ncbi:MAG: ribonuclease D [Alphaproteobacteria bacterium]|nr:ribonuclease D [Alphaproteobacteria bacterium]